MEDPWSAQFGNQMYTTGGVGISAFCARTPLPRPIFIWGSYLLTAYRGKGFYWYIINWTRILARHRGQLSLDDDLKASIFEYTAGHAGAVVDLLTFINPSVNQVRPFNRYLNCLAQSWSQRKAEIAQIEQISVTALLFIALCWSSMVAT